MTDLDIMGGVLAIAAIVIPLLGWAVSLKLKSDHLSRKIDFEEHQARRERKLGSPL